MMEPAIRQLLNELPMPWKECLEEHYLEGRTQQEIAQRRGISQSTVSRYLDAGLHEMKERLRSKGVVCGTALTVIASAQSASASCLPSASCSGSIAASGAHSSTPVSAFSSAVLTMKATKLVIAAAAAAALVGIPVFLYHHRAEEPVKPAAAKPASAAAASGFARPGKTKAGGAATAPQHYRPEPVTEEVRRKADALVQRCGGMSEQQLMRDPEMQKLIENFMRLFETELASSKSPRVERALTNLWATKGIEPPGPNNKSGPPGFAVNFLKPGALNEPLGRSWIEASMSNDPKRVQDWMLNRLEGATFEFSVDPGLDRSGEGVSVMKPPAPKKDIRED